MACCTMCTVLVSTTKLPNEQLTIWRFSNRTKYTRHRTTGHLTVDTWRSPRAHARPVDNDQVYDLPYFADSRTVGAVTGAVKKFESRKIHPLPLGEGRVRVSRFD